MSNDAKQNFWSSVLFGLASAILGVSLPILWPHLSTLQATAGSLVALMLVVLAGLSAYRTHRSNSRRAGLGGAGGRARGIGIDNDVEGGCGGDANRGTGGKGGDAI
ncbi:hypothetical protein D3C86_806660 [compost metagenome]